MSCPATRTGTGAYATVQAARLPFPGEQGMIKIKYMGTNGNADARGEVTGAKYPFSRQLIMFVDARDAVFLLGTDYIFYD